MNVTYTKVLPAMLSFLLLFAPGPLHRRGARSDATSKDFHAEPCTPLVIAFPFEPLLEVRKGLQLWTLQLADPALRDLIDWDRIDEMQPLSALALPRDKIRLLQDGEMLRYCLARHMQSLTKFSERLAILLTRAIEQPSGAPPEPEKRPRPAR